MPDKAKRALSRFEPHLTHDEQILWVGQPDAHKFLSLSDVYLIPFSLFWCGFVMGFGRSTFGIAIFLVPHFWAGMYLLWGRYVHKYLRRRNLYYAVTNRRILIHSAFLRPHLESLYIKTLPAINLRTGSNGSGTVTFEADSQWHRQGNWSATLGEDKGKGFYDIPDVQDVYHLINDLHSEHEYDDERYKRKVDDIAAAIHG